MTALLERKIGPVTCAVCSRVVKGYRSRVYYGAGREPEDVPYPCKHNHGTTKEDCPGRFQRALLEIRDAE